MTPMEKGLSLAVVTAEAVAAAAMAAAAAVVEDPGAALRDPGAANWVETVTAEAVTVPVSEVTGVAAGGAQEPMVTAAVADLAGPAAP